jgi:hypothetical protein
MTLALAERSLRAVGSAGLVGLAALTLALVSLVGWPVVPLAAAQGVGDASWTPVTSTTTVLPGRLIVADDALVFQTDAVWDREQVDGLARYMAQGLRYTHEVNDRSGRLSATGYWVTNLPDPAYDRDDDDGDGRWEEAEITAGALPPSSRPPDAGQRYVTAIQFSRWHGKRERGACVWAWDRRMGEAEILSQLSREFLGEWQAERFTLTYAREAFPRVGERPELDEEPLRAACGDARPGPSQAGLVVTFSQPLTWSDFLGLPAQGAGRWTAFEAVGGSAQDALTWTCGGPVSAELDLRPCRDMGMEPRGVVAAVGYFDADAQRALRESPLVARSSELQDAVTGLLFDVGGFGVERPGLTVNDAWWDVSGTSR